MALWLLPFAVQAAPTVEVAAVDGAHVQRPRFSPDGKKLSYEANDHATKRIELWVGDPVTRSFQKVAPGAKTGGSITAGFKTSGPKGGAVVHELAWSPAQYATYTFAATNDLEDYDLYVQGGSTVAPSPAAEGGAAWSPDGRWMVFTSARTGQGDLYLLDVQRIDQPPRALTSDKTHSELAPAWSPDAKSVVFVGHGDQGDNLWVLDSLDAPARQLTTWSGSQVRPSWSSAGKIAFYANHADPAQWDLYVVDPKGGEPAKVASDVVLDGNGPRFTPDGKWLVYVADDDAKFDPIRCAKVDGTGTAVPFDGGTVGNGDLDVVTAPDGTWRIAWAAQGRTGDKERTFDRLFVGELPKLP